ncbi:MAG: sigma-70 family RNA polymerase sigma factor [Pyrinomonadaceae bacterium]
MSFVEPIALPGQIEIEEVAPLSAAFDGARCGVEAKFIERLQTGDATAFDELVRERSGEVYALLFRLTEDTEEARDLTQETFLRAFQSIKVFRGDADLKTWLYRIAVNQARNRWRWWRRRQRNNTFSLDAPDGRHSDESFGARLPATETIDPEQQTLARERETVLRAALHTLKFHFREVVILRDVEGLSYEEVAAALSINVGTVKSRLARGRIELRRKLNGAL